jgi:hypothetical protein
VVAVKNPTEKEMRQVKAPWPKSESELTEYLAEVAKQATDYGTCVYAISLATTATFNYMCHVVGATGFQASCADLDVLRRTRSMDCPFMVVRAEDALYPQYDVPQKVAKFLDEVKPWLKEQAAKRLAESCEHAAKTVIAHWQKLAEARA